MRTRDAFNVDPAGHSNYNPMRQFWDATLTQDVWPAVWGWRLLNARCSLAVLGWRLLVCHSNIAISLSAAILIWHCGLQ